MIRVGQRLYEARLNQSLSIDQVSKATKIRPNFLTAIEKGEYDKLPSFTYAQGFVCNYADFLNVPRDEALALFRREVDEKKHVKVLPDTLSVPKNSFIPRVYFHQALVAFILGLTILFGYLGYQLRTMFIPPPLAIESPLDNAQTQSSIIVTGTSDPNATIYVNNESVSISPDGKFTKTLTLFPGKNTITVKSKNRFGKETILERQIVVKK